MASCVDSGAVLLDFIKKSSLGINCFVCLRLNQETLALANAEGRQLRNGCC